ncbi:class I SAM-dependent methyltransferase [Crenobacter sp. SG2303]|uniref:Class I SAM-dependent methyltransferase n=1 Tax=Crenobacter oryzisoli TaxID=3056844 RepID=A0ABT7XUP6_9NEIS|nr:class I SAM-dependent methyltransferase [Crenobacter sp. SG2303]MDN0077523.1 class I SAM-dependent methyltransferase [Crenobacter sp. SG2303]
MSFQDHFSGHAADYARYRPDYPDELFAWLAGQVPAHELALDVATGNGQAAHGLVRHFARVRASDASAAQLAEAPADPRISYVCEAAEQCALPDASVDLITVAQALHWLDQPRFFAEVKRLLKPGGALAVWHYPRLKVGGELGAVYEAFHATVAPYWPPERLLVEQGYQTIAWPFPAEPVPAFTLERRWDLAALLGYLGSWSSTRRAAQALGSDPVAAYTPRFADAWGAEMTRLFRWPLQLYLGHRLV